MIAAISDRGHGWRWGDGDSIHYPVQRAGNKIVVMLRINQPLVIKVANRLRLNLEISSR